MSGDYLVAFVLCVALGGIGGAYRPWGRFPSFRDTPWPVRAVVLGAVSAGIFLVLSLLTGLFYFFSGPASPVPLAVLTILFTLSAVAALSGDGAG